MTTTSQLYELAYRARFDDQVSRGAAAAAAAMRDMGAATETTDTAVRRSTQTFDQLARKLDPMTRYKRDMARAEAEYARAVAAATQAAEKDAAAQERATAVIRAAGVQRAEAMRRADEALQRSQQRFAAFDAAMQATTRTAEASARAILELATPFERMRAAQANVVAETQRLEQRFRPLVAINQEYRRGLEDVTKAERLLGLTTKEAEAERNKLATAYERQRAALAGVASTTQRVTQATQQVAASTRLSAQQLTQLSYQANDVFVGLASGQSPLMILVQQGPQITQALGGVRQSFALLASAVTPMRAGIALGVAAFAGFVAIAEQTERRLSTLRGQLRAYQADYAAMAASIEQSSRRQALASPGFSLGDITAAQARIAQAMPAGGVGRSISDLTDLAKDLSRTLDQDLASAATRVARALRDPAAVARELADQRFPGMTEELRRTIEVLQTGGDRATAFNLLLDRMRGQVGGAAADMSPLQRALAGLQKSFADLWEAIRPAMEGIGRHLVTWLSSVANNLGAVARGIGSVIEAARNSMGPPGAGSTGTVGAGNRPAGYAYSGGAASLPEAIRFVESGGRYGDTSRTGSFLGAYQMGQAALAQVGMYERPRVGVTPWGGTFNVPGFPNVRTREDFLATPGAQDAAAAAYLAHLNSFIDQRGLLSGNPSVGGTPVTREALLGVMWGAGPGDGARWLQSGGTYNPADGNGVTPTQRLGWFSQGGAVPVTVVGVSGGAGSPGAGGTPAGSGNQLAIDDALRAARGLGLRSDRGEDLRSTIQMLERAQGMVEHGGETWNKLKEGIDAARAALLATESPTQQFLRTGRQQIEVLQAQDGAAREVAEAMMGLRRAVEQERGAGAQPTATEEAEARRQVFARLSAQYEDASRALDRQTASEERIAEAMRRGTAAGSAQESQERATEEVRRTAIAGTSQYSQAVADLAAKYDRLKQAQADRATAQQTQQQRDEIALIEAETRLITASVEVRERELAVIRARNDIVRRGGDPDSEASRDALAVAERLASARVESDRFRSSFEELQNIGERAFDRIGESITQGFANGTVSAIKFGNIGKAVLAELAQAAIRLGLLNPLSNWVMGTNLPTLGSVGQVAGQMIGGGSAGSSGGLGGLGNLQSAGSLFSSSTWGGGGGWFSGFGGLLGGSTAPAISSLPALPTAGSIAGTVPSAGMTIGGAALGSWAAGIGLGYMGGSMLGGYLAGDSPARQLNAQIGAGGGAVAGAAIGTMIFPGVGTVIGGVLGGLAGGGGGGLIGPGAPFRGGDVGIGVGPDGLLRVTGAGGKNWNAGGATQAAQQQIDQLNAILRSGGITIQGVQSGYDWKGGDTLGFMGSGASDNVFGPSEIFARVRSGLTGSNDTMNALLRQSFIQSWEDIAKTAPYAMNDNANLRTALGSGGIRSVDDVATAANFIAQIYEPLTTAEEKASSWADRIKQINDTFGSAIDTAQRFGLATDELVRRQQAAVDAFQNDHNLAYTGIVVSLQARSLTARAAVETDPTKQLALQRQAALAEFDYNARLQRRDFDNQLIDMGFDRWNPAEYTRLLAEQEKVLAEERLAVLKGFQAQATAIEKQRVDQARAAVTGVVTNLADYAAGLRTGPASPLSPQQQFNAAQRSFDAVAGRAIAGDFTSAQKLRDYADTYLEHARDVYGGGSGYAEAFSRVMEVLTRVSTTSTDQLTKSAQQAIAREQTAVLVDELRRLRSEMQALRAEVAQGSSAPRRAS